MKKRETLFKNYKFPRTTVGNIKVGSVGVQNKPPPNGLLLHEAHFELNAIKTLRVQEKLTAALLTT